MDKPAQVSKDTPQACMHSIRILGLAACDFPRKAHARRLAPGIRQPLPAPALFHFPVAGTAPPFNRASFTFTPTPTSGRSYKRVPPDPRLYGRCKVKLCSECKAIPALVQGSRYARFRQH